MTTSRITFETKTCTRCDGEGTYGPVQVDNGRCFSCLGKGIILTRRGKLAKAVYDENLDAMNVAYEDIKVGDKVFLEFGFNNPVRRWAIIEESAADPLNVGRWQIRTTRLGKRYGFGGVTRAYVADHPEWTKPTVARVWDEALYNRAVNVAALMPGASLVDDAPVADVVSGAPKTRTAGTRSSHATCTHESTPAARAACRKARKA